MDINELETYRLSDAYRYNDNLNPRLWAADQHLRQDVKDSLLKIADDFREFLGIEDLKVKDIIIIGSNAAYSYTPHSDVDLHLLVDVPEDSVYKELFNAKKYQYNDEYNYKIGPYDVELYAQDIKDPVVSQGIYSVLNDKWLSVPRRRRPEIDDTSVKNKYQDLGLKIDHAIESGDVSEMDQIIEKVKNYRRAGLADTGEYGPENLAYKVLRNNGTVNRLFAARNEARSKQLSIAEKQNNTERRTYGYATPVLSILEPVTESNHNRKDINANLDHFVSFATTWLQLPSKPRIRIRKDPVWAKRNHTFGRYDPDKHEINVVLANRHPADVMRTIAHELTHHLQTLDGRMHAHSGETGSQEENEANAKAGQIMRDYADQHEEIFKDLDIANEDYDPNDTPPGPESRPTMPAGTVRVDVSDVYDWYKLGQHISNLKGLGRHDFGKGPPSTIISFGSEPEEHKYIRDLEKTGLTTTDIDPKDVSAPKGMKKQKVDPTYNVAEGKTPKKIARSFSESSGYIPVNSKEAQNPKYVMAMTQDIRPGETQRQAAKLGFRTNRAGVPPQAKTNGIVENIEKRLTDLLADIKSQSLLEVSQNPKAYRQWLDSFDAEGIMAGFEAEMIFKDAHGGAQKDRDDDYDENEMVADYDEDREPGDIDDVIDFFSYDDWGYGLSPRAARNLRIVLQDRYAEWRDEKIAERWNDDYAKIIAKWVDDNVDAEDIAKALDIPVKKFENMRFQERIDLLTQYASGLDSTNEWYQQAEEEFNEYEVDSNDLDEESFLVETYGNMETISNRHHLDWPYYTEEATDTYREPKGDRSPEDIARSLSHIVGMPVDAGSGYHSVTRRPGRWIIEKDTSLEPDEYSSTGLEIVSPPMPLKMTLEKLQDVYDWAHSAEGDAYTNESTGLHMNISIPYKGGDVDYVKLIMFMGDEYILKKFERDGNFYCKSAFRRIADTNLPIAKKQGLLEASTVDPVGAIDLIQKNLIELASRYVQDGVGIDKYTSAHIKGGKNGKPAYIEFRSPGGNYLNKKPETLTNTMLRFARALQIAGNPAAYRKEYAKKLTKMLTAPDRPVKVYPEKGGRERRVYPSEQNKFFDIFKNNIAKPLAQYWAGEMDKSSLDQWLETAKQKWSKDFVQRQSDRDTTSWSVIAPDGIKLTTVKAKNRDDAKNQLKDLPYAVTGSWRVHQLKVVPQKPGIQNPPRSQKATAFAKSMANRNKYYRVTDSRNNMSVMVTANDLEDAYTKAKDKFARQGHTTYQGYLSAEVIPYKQAVDNAGDAETDNRRVQAATLKVKPSGPSGPAWSDNSGVTASGTGSYMVISSSTALPLGQYDTEEQAMTAAREWANQRNERVLVRHGLGTRNVEPGEPPRRQDGSMTAPETDPDANYAIIRSSDDAVKVYFTRNTRAEAERSFTQWLASQGITGDTTHPYYLIAIRPRRDPESSQNDAQEQPRRQDGSITAPESDPDANYAIIRSIDNAPIVYFTRNTRQEAEEAFTIWLSARTRRPASDPESGYYLIAIRPRRDSESRAND